MSEITPALAAEEWGKLSQFPSEYEGSGVYVEGDAVVVEYTYITNQRHALAALCLYGQPFGLTSEDILTLEGHLARMAHSPGVTWDDNAKMLSLRDRIAALLPPSSP